MGQNQDKLDEGEQVLDAAQEETCPDPDSGSADDVMEGGSSSKAEAGNSRQSREPDAPDLDGCSSQENTRLWVRPFAASEVRQGGAAGMAGRRGGDGGEGGWANKTDQPETDENLRSSPMLEGTAGARKLHIRIKKEGESAEGELRRSKAKMEGTEKCSPHEEIQDEHLSAAAHERCDHAFTSGDANALPNSDGERAPLKTSPSGAQAGRQFLSSIQQDEGDAITAGMTARDIKLSAGTVGRLSERKDPPTAQSLHPLKNSEKKEPLSDMSDAIHSRPANGRTENDTKEGTPACEAESSCSPTRPKTLDARQSEATTNKKINSHSATSPTANAEPSSILEKLLMRNKKQKILSDIREAEANETDSVDDAAQRTVATAATELAHSTDKSALNTLLSTCSKKRAGEKPHGGNGADKGHRIQGQGVKQPDTSDSSPEHFQTVTENIDCKSSLINPKSASGQSSKDNESTSSVSDQKIPAKSDEQSVASCSLLPGEKSNCKPSLQNNSGSKRSSEQSDKEKKDMTQESPLTERIGDTGSRGPSETLVKKNEDNTSERDDSQDLPKSRPVSELIKETVQMHEKLRHQEWSKPAEVKADEQGQSVKVAQMKAAFDLVQKSPDRSIERKPSVRKGKGKILLLISNIT